MANKFIMVGMDDERVGDIADVLGNKTCKKIIDHLSEIKEASEKDIADKLSIPINTVEYNLNKLVKSGLIEKSRNFFWSIKGKKIEMYRLSNKKIIISPKSYSKGIIPALIGLGLFSFGLKFLSDRINSSYQMPVIENVVKGSAPSASDALVTVGQAGKNLGVEQFGNIQNVCQSIGTEAWAWFLLGGLVVILIFLLWNQYKRMKGGF